MPKAKQRLIEKIVLLENQKLIILVYLIKEIKQLLEERNQDHNLVEDNKNFLVG
jgi:hypothetical protein